MNTEPTPCEPSIDKLEIEVHRLNARLSIHSSQRTRLAEALRDVLSLIDEQWLVRNIERDGEPDFAIRQLEPTRKLARAHAVLAELNTP